jgi:hypothetical protein
MGMAIIYGLKVNLSVCIVAMVNNTALQMRAAGGGGHGMDGHDMSMANLTTHAMDVDPGCVYPADENSGGGGGFEVTYNW